MKKKNDGVLKDEPQWFVRNYEVSVLSERRDLYSSSRSEMVFKVDVLKNFVNLTGKHLCQSLFFNKIAVLRAATLLTNIPDTGVFL